MKRKLYFGIGIVILASVLAGGAGWYANTRALIAPTALRASGTIESDDIVIAAEVPGRIIALNADEGAEVKAGDALVQLDTAMIDGQIAQAQAGLEVARANLARIQAAALPDEIRVAKAALAQAIATRDGARQAWLDAQTARDDPQELDARIDAARAALAAAEASIQQAEGLADAALTGQDEVRHLFDRLDGKVTVPVQTPRGSEIISFQPAERALNQLSAQLGLADRQVDIAFAGVDAAKTARDAAQANLDNLLAIRANPLEANARVDLAWAQYQAQEGAVQIAQAKLDKLNAGATKEQIAAAAAQVAAAEAALNGLNVQRSKLTLTAPRDSYVVQRLANRGELAAPGAPLLKLADLDSLTMTVYLPTSELGRIRIGDAARMTVDSFTGRTFDGQVIFISPDAEFTPRNTQTQDDRTTLVYAVKISLSDPDHALKPGLSGNVEFAPGNEEPVSSLPGL